MFIVYLVSKCQVYALAKLKFEDSDTALVSGLQYNVLWLFRRKTWKLNKRHHLSVVVQF